MKSVALFFFMACGVCPFVVGIGLFCYKEYALAFFILLVTGLNFLLMARSEKKTKQKRRQRAAIIPPEDKPLVRRRHTYRPDYKHDGGFSKN